MGGNQLPEKQIKAKKQAAQQKISSLFFYR
jgi:hypothetical protein